MRLLQYFSWVIGLGLELAVIAALLRSAYKKFAFVFAYSITLFLTTVVEVAAYTSALSGARRAQWILYYWVNDVILQVLIFCVVISLIYQATAQAGRKPILRRWLIFGAFLFTVVSFLSHRDPQLHLSLWMTQVSRDLSFCSVILNLLLWFTLIASRQKDQRLLLLSGGLGIQFTGAAIGQSLRQLSRNTTLAGTLIEVSSSLICLYIWQQAFRRSAAEVKHRAPLQAQK